MINAESALICATHCAMLKEPKCRSFNFIEDPAIVQNCELLSRATLVANLETLIPRSGVLYFEEIRGVANILRFYWKVQGFKCSEISLTLAGIETTIYGMLAFMPR